MDRTKDPTPGDAHTLTDWENYFRKRADDAQDAMYRLRDIQNQSTSLDLEGTWITAIWGRCDYLADQLLPEQTCHQNVADAMKSFRHALPDIQADADYGLKTAREAAADHRAAAGALHAIDMGNAAADQAAGVCVPGDPATLHRTRAAQGDLNDAEGRIRKAKGIVNEAAANFHTAATALIAALNESVRTLGTGVFDPVPPDRDQTPPPHPGMLHQAVINELNGLYITASVATGVMRRTDDIGENVDEMMMFGGPESGGPGDEFALTGDSMSASLADSYAFGDDPFSGYGTNSPSKPLDDPWLMSKTWQARADIKGPARGKVLKQPNARHTILGSKGGEVKGENTIIPPDRYDDVDQDIKAIADGEAAFDNRTGLYEFHGRTYNVKPSGTVFPVSGPGLVEMDNNDYFALHMLAKCDGNVEKFDQQVQYNPRLRNNPASVAKATALYDTYYEPGGVPR
ncbi:hypothetical protein [Streptantibioticus silvisoli]|uniref:WXG100 family type VII secretion target n=1 Tax=Streptantibioticus silvisoli TaxID=2705255 RepID=A0ABT6VWA2_9ACTN|nr:hypothetical protein [Streptantibioticus silvisoli]MDI5962771.1 hypothetical protein [Streptantibioticus silvisoli]